jgi:S1-C subfamily serine protease
VKYAVTYLYLFLLSVMSTCCTHQPARAPTELYRDISGETVALIARDNDGDVFPFCTGVWISSDLILTAAHCVSAVLTEGTAPLGSEINYIVQSEVAGQYKEPKAWHRSVVKKYDEEHDLALLSAPSAPGHDNIRLAQRAPQPGAALAFVGQAHTYYWTVMRGTYSTSWAELLTLPRKGPWMQINAPIAQGMSGSGAFDEFGQMVGLCSAVATTTPDTAFYVHLDTIRKFLN